MTPPGRPDVKSLDREALGEAVSSLGEPRYRARQLERWLYAKGVRSFEEMTDLPAALRERLAAAFSLSNAEVLERQVSGDGARKYLVGYADGERVECVGLPEGRRLTVCFSTQAGCAMGCAFCATGLGGLSRDLTSGEMTDQVRAVAEDFGQRVTNAVAMGQGEPFANYDATLAALRFLNSADGFGIGARHLTVSTCGLLPGIARFAGEEEQFTLAVSLHSAVQRTRDRLMPGLRGVTLPALREAIGEYSSRSGRRPSIEYALVEGVNDTPAELEALVEFCRGTGAHVNLIPMNLVDGAGFTRASRDTASRFARALAGAGVEASVRRERGADIDAACGQLRQRERR